MTPMVTVTRRVTIRSCSSVSSETVDWFLCVVSTIPNCFHLRKRTAVHTAMSASWIGVTQSSQLTPKCKASVTDSVVLFFFLCFFKVLFFAAWAQRVWTVVIQEAGMRPAHVSNRSEWRSSAKLRLQGIKPGYLCERTGQSRRRPWAPPPLLSDSLSGISPPAGSVSGLVEQDVSWLRVLGNVRRQTVELLDRLRVNFLQEKKNEWLDFRHVLTFCVCLCQVWGAVVH